jgi:hypothetical protein
MVCCEWHGIHKCILIYQIVKVMVKIVLLDIYFFPSEGNVKFQFLSLESDIGKLKTKIIYLPVFVICFPNENKRNIWSTK